jgi:hypothetical protein
MHGVLLLLKSSKLRPLRKSLISPKIDLINQYIVEQAPSPAKYSRGRLFYMLFAEVSNLRFKVGAGRAIPPFKN